MNPEISRACPLFLLPLVLLLILSCNGNGNPQSGNSGNDTQQNEPAQAVNSAYEYIYDAMDRDFQTFSVYTDADAKGNHFVPSGYFNGTASLKINTRWTENPYSGTSCIQVMWDGIPGNDGWLWAHGSAKIFSQILYSKPQCSTPTLKYQMPTPASIIKSLSTHPDLFLQKTHSRRLPKFVSK